VIIIELGSPFQALPGAFSGALAGHVFRRWWWGWVAVSHYPASLMQFRNIIATQPTEWRGLNPPEN